MAGRSGFDYRAPRDMHVLRRTELTAGAGLFVPIKPGIRARVIIQGAGGGGSNGNSSPGRGGGAGGYIDADMVLLGPAAYIVGAAGAAGQPAHLDAAGQAGSASSFGSFVAGGGAGGNAPTSAVRAAGGAIPHTGLAMALAGGQGGVVSSAAESLGYIPGAAYADPRCVPLLWTSTIHYGCGGSSVMGQGGDTNSAAGRGYGAGGRGGLYQGHAPGSGSGGIIVVEEYE